MINHFTYTTFAQQIIFGSGALHKATDAIASFGWQRLLLCTSATYRRNGMVDQLRRLLGDRLGRFANVGAKYAQKPGGER